ncbi:MAG: CotH kinase family protein, partial [Clostridia bacterium]|nr:CotH kinase family protein [Clostridia bacterium]
MKRNVRNLTILILFLVFALSLCVFSACSDTNDADPGVKPQGATVTVSLDFSDERGVVRVSGKVGELTMEYALPEREGYAFGGWYLNDELYDFVVYPNRDISLTARWLEGVTVRFNTGSSDVVLDDMVVVQGETIPEPIVEREGYLLRRWTYLNIEFDFDTPITTDITLTAEWLERTNLPTMSVELLSSMGNTISLSSVTRETYVDSEITLTNADGDYVLFSTDCEFKGRGNGSWEAEKKGYKLKFAKKQGLFGRAANKHWVVLACANFDDQTMCRNLTAYEMAGQILGGIEYVTNAVWIDFYVNGEYRGVYVLCEHVRVGDGRVVLTSQYGVEDTGYLIEYDAYAEG